MIAPDPQIVRPIVIEPAPAASAAQELGMGDVILQALGLTGLLVLGSLLLGVLLAWAIISFRRSRRDAGIEAAGQIRLHLEPPVRHS